MFVKTIKITYMLCTSLSSFVFSDILCYDFKLLKCDLKLLKCNVYNHVAFVHYKRNVRFFNNMYMYTMHTCKYVHMNTWKSRPMLFVRNFRGNFPTALSVGSSLENNS